MPTVHERDAEPRASALRERQSGDEVRPRRHGVLTMAQVAIVISAASAGDHLETVLDAMSPDLVDSVGAILVDVHGSTDAAIEVARRRAAARPGNAHVVHPRNLGRGGSQKYFLRWALDQGYSIVVFVQDDVVWAATRLEALVAPLIEGEADAVSVESPMTAPTRSVKSSSAVARRMRASIRPWRSGTRVTKSLGGCCAYNLHRLDIRSVDALDDGFAFGADMVRYLTARGRRIVEIPRHHP